MSQARTAGVAEEGERASETPIYGILPFEEPRWDEMKTPAILLFATDRFQDP